MRHLLVLTPAPTPYRDPFWAEVARQPGVELLVCYLAHESRDRPWQVTWKREFPYRELPGYNLLGWRGPTEACFWNSDVPRLVRRDQCDALILGGYNHLSLVVAMILARRRGIPFFVMSESHLRNRRPPWKAGVKRPFLRWIVRNSAGLFPTGVLAAEYFRHYSATDEKMTFIPNVPDVEALTRQTLDHLGCREEIRSRLSLADKRVILFAGRLIPKKGVHTLIEACSKLPAEMPWYLAIVGEGTFRPHLEELSRTLGVADRVRFVGFVQPEQLPDWYLAADVFVLPSSETWGVVAIEALACGLPVILSDQTGCWPDALEPSDHERCVFRFGDADDLAKKLHTRLSVFHDRAEVLRNRALHLQKYYYVTLAKRLVGFTSSGEGHAKTLLTPAELAPIT